MRALELDYRRKSNWRQRAGWSVLLLVCLALGDQVWQYRLLAMEVEAGEAELTRLTARPYIKQSDLGSHQGKALEAEIGRAREVLMQLDVPWTALFGAVEASTNAEIALLGIEPEPKRGEVRIIGEAKDYPAVLDYARRLEAGASLAGVHLQSHQVQTQDRERPVRFVLGATWKGRP